MVEQKVMLKNLLHFLNNPGRAIPNSDIRFINASKFAEHLIKKDRNLIEEALLAGRKKMHSD